MVRLPGNRSMFDKPANKNAVTCLVIMAACLAFEGILLAAEGFPFYEHLSLLTRVLGFAWILTVISCFFYDRRPVLPLLGGVAILLVNSIDLWKSDPETHYLDWFLYMHFFELLFLVATCVGAFSNWRSRNFRA